MEMINEHSGLWRVVVFLAIVAISVYIETK